MAAGLGAAFSRPIPIAENVPIAEIDNNNNTSTSNATPTAPPNSLPPTHPPTKPSYECFANRTELKFAVDRYVKDGCGSFRLCPTILVETYGWPIGSWCVGNITDMSSLFEGLDTFDEDISGWRVDRVTDMSRMFADAGMFKRDLSSWNMSSVTSTEKCSKVQHPLTRIYVRGRITFLTVTRVIYLLILAAHTSSIHHLHIKVLSALRLATMSLLLTALLLAMSSRLRLINTFEETGILPTVSNMDGQLDLGV
jgi:hypothetical protein